MEQLGCGVGTPRMAEDIRSETASTTDLAGYKLGKAIVESARPAARQFTNTYNEDKKFATGENQWPVPTSYRAWYASRWKNQGVRNYLWGMIQHKLAICLDREPSVRAEPLNELSTFAQRQDIAAATRHELERMRWNDYAHDAMMDGAFIGKGHTHVFPLRDPYTGLYELHLEAVDPQRFYPDPTKSRLHECRFVVYEPELDMATLRRIFPDTWQLIKPQNRPIGKLNDATYSRTDSELIYGPSTGEIGITKDGMMVERVANVAFIYLKDPSVIEEVKDVLEKEPSMGFKCQNCGNEFERDDAVVMADNPKMAHCPECMGVDPQQIMLPPQFRTIQEKRKLYPNGRLICITDNALLYDDENPHQLSGVFPFAACEYYRVSGRYWGYGDVALLKRVQQALNKNMSQAIDFMRLAGNGPLEVPAEVPAYRNLGNAPGDQVPVPAPFMGLARYLSPTGYNVQMHQIIDEALRRDMQEVSGVTDVALGIAPSAPTSGVEVQSRQRAASTRLGLHLKALNQYRSDLADIVWQMMNQYYAEPRAYQLRRPSGELEAIVLEVSELPRDVAVKVSANIDQIEKDNLFGQNLMMAVEKGQVPFYADLMLPMMGADPEVAREIQARMQSDLQMQQAAMMAGGAPPQPPSPPGGTSGSEQALQAEGI